MTIEVLYFAWVRERVGVPRETLDSSAETVADLVAELKARGDGYALAFEDMDVVRAALDQELVELSTPLNGAREVAFFPPMTGG